MRIVRLENIQPGDILGKSIFNDRGELVLASGFRLNEKLITKLRSSSFHYVYVMDLESSELLPEKIISEIIKSGAQKTVSNVYKEVIEAGKEFLDNPKKLEQRMKYNNKFGKKFLDQKLYQSVMEIFSATMKNYKSFLLSLPIQANPGSHFQHAADVCVLSILIGITLKLDKEIITVLSNAALLHDIGRMIYAQLVEKEDSQLSREERRILQEHPVYSMLLLRAISPHTPHEQMTMLQHHENFDGSGYPIGLKGADEPPSITSIKSGKTGQIFGLAEILRVINEYDQLTKGLYGSNEYSPLDALRIMKVQAGTQLNPHIVKVLTKLVELYPVGTTVRIKETSSLMYANYQGIVVETNSIDPERPVILLTQNALGAPLQAKRVDFSTEERVVLEIV